MTQFFLVRHAAHDNVGAFLAGRTPGIRLGEAGRAQAARLAQRMRQETVSAIYASPRERTQETAEAIADACGIAAISTEPRLDEIDFGAWSGKTFDALNADPEWRRWNAVRSLGCTPAGETMLDVQARILQLIRSLHARGDSPAIVLVSHADVIKAAVAFYLGLSLDAWSRFDIEPASLTTLVIDDWSAKITGLNERGG